MSVDSALAKRLLQINAIKLSPQKPFTWASGWLSPIYCDNRMSLSYPEVRNSIKSGLAELSSEFDFDVVIGVATAGIPHGMLLADAIDAPFGYVRSKSKSHGRQNQIEGDIKPGQKALVVEDLISTGGSALAAIAALRDAGIEVVGLLAIFTYGFSHSVMAMEKAEVPFKTLLNYENLLEEACKLSYISKTDLSQLQLWRKAPEHWQPIER